METLDRIGEIMDRMLRQVPRERDYNAVFEQISSLLMKHSYHIRALDLRFRFTLFMQEEFDAIPKEEWKLDEPLWIREKERKAKDKLIRWIKGELES